MEHEIDRLDKYLQMKGINDHEFTIHTGISNGWIGKARKEKSSLTQKTRHKIITKFPDLNESWLTTGKGDMLTTLRAALKDTREVQERPSKDADYWKDKYYQKVDENNELLRKLLNKE